MHNSNLKRLDHSGANQVENFLSARYNSRQFLDFMSCSYAEQPISITQDSVVSSPQEYIREGCRPHNTSFNVLYLSSSVPRIEVYSLQFYK